MIENKIGLSMILFLRRSRNLIGMGGQRKKIKENDFSNNKDPQKHTKVIMIVYKNVLAVLLLLAINIGCASSQQIAMLKSGVENWNKWRVENSKVIPTLRKADLDSANLRRADLRGANLRYAHLEGAHLEGALLEGAVLWDANLEGVHLDSANLLGADLRGADLERADLREANLDSADLREANLERADLDSANLRKTNLLVANLSRIFLEGAHLEGATLGGAFLWDAHLAGAHLAGVHLWQATLYGADLDNADLRDADLRGAHLDSVNLNKVISLYKAKIDPSILSKIKTNWPEKLATFWDDTKENWAIDHTLLEKIKKPD
jgi:uncharacterized protein YjbI with pentapeptide repeats